MKAVSTQALDGLEQILSGANAVPIDDGRIRLVWTSLPGRTAVAAAEVDGVLWILIDDEKPLGRAHAAELVANELCAPGGAEGLRRIPTSSSAGGPCRLQLVS